MYSAHLGGSGVRGTLFINSQVDLSTFQTHVSKLEDSREENSRRLEKASRIDPLEEV